jgi:hypothetical protein
MNFLQNNLFNSLKNSNKQINHKLFYLNKFKNYNYNLETNLYLKLIENINTYKCLINSIGLVLDNINYILITNIILNYFYFKFNFSTINDID